MQRIPSLDGLRAISIAMVVLGHLAIRGQASQVWIYYPNIGVRMFFVISGFLITTILLRERARNGYIDLKQFYIRRAFRILPAAFVFAFLMIAFFWQGFVGIKLCRRFSMSRTTPLQASTGFSGTSGL